MKKALFYDPYIGTLGGGERYTFTLAEYLLKNQWLASIVGLTDPLVQQLQNRLNLDLAQATPATLPNQKISLWKMMHQYDLLFWVSDGSIPFMYSKNNILHFQVPFHNVNGKSFGNLIKFKNINHVVCNSHFTQQVINKEYGLSSIVVYPPIAVEDFLPGKKENLILTVGRFSQLLQNKRQDVLIPVFKKLVDQGVNNWRFVITGATDIGGKEYFNHLKSISQGYPIELIENPSFSQLQKLYAKAKIFWYAAGLGVDDQKEPEKAEHFGIVTVEAMAAGCVPLDYNKGGVREVIASGKNGYLWETTNELLLRTKNIINDEKTRKVISEVAQIDSRKYSKNVFCDSFIKII